MRIAIAILAMAIAFGGIRATMAAFTDSGENTGNNVSSVTLGATSSVTASAPTNSSADSLCQANNIDIVWSAVTNADSYRVQKSVDGGAWTDVNTETGNVTTISDGTSYSTNQRVQYKVFARIDTPNWESASSTTSNTLQCGVVDLTASQQSCANGTVTLSWAAAAGADTYDIEYSTNGGGAWNPLVSNHNTNSYSDATARTEGNDVRFHVRPGYSTTANYGSWSNTSPKLTDSGWVNGFKVLNIAFANVTGTLGTIDGGDTVTLKFSRALDTSTPAGTNANSIYFRKANPGTIWIGANTNAAGSMGVGAVDTGTNGVFGASNAYTGTWGYGADSLGNANRVATWAKGAGAGTTFAAVTWTTTFTDGTSAANPGQIKCTGGTTNLTAAAAGFAVSGRL